jgi:hypothetical protein
VKTRVPRTGVRCRETFRPLGYGLTTVEPRPMMRYSGLSPDRRRRCGNVEIARLGFWRDFQARWEAWKSPGVQFSLCGGRRPDFSTLSTARHFHSDFPQPFSRRSTAGHPEIRRRFLGALMLVENLLPVR